MTRVHTPEMVLQQMQVLDQQIGPPFTLAKQCLHLVERDGIDLPAFRVIGSAPPSRARMYPPVVMC